MHVLIILRLNSSHINVSKLANFTHFQKSKTKCGSLCKSLHTADTFFLQRGISEEQIMLKLEMDLIFFLSTQLHRIYLCHRYYFFNVCVHATLKLLEIS